jgi:hypothetical protein
MHRAVGGGVDNLEKDIEIFVVNLDGTGSQRLTKNAGRELHVMRADGENSTNLTDDPASDLTPTGSRWRESGGVRRSRRSRARQTEIRATWKREGPKRIRSNSSPPPTLRFARLSRMAREGPAEWDVNRPFLFDAPRCCGYGGGIASFSPSAYATASSKSIVRPSSYATVHARSPSTSRAVATTRWWDSLLV